MEEQGGATNTHSAHPRRNKVRGGAQKAHTAAVTVHRAQVREESFSRSVRSSSLLLHPGHPDCFCGSVTAVGGAAGEMAT